VSNHVLELNRYLTDMTAVRGLDLVRHMQYFLAVVDELHFGRAADHLGISQPPLSQGIQRLERRLGAALFDRGTVVRLTSAGEDLVPKARRLVAAAADVVEHGALQPDTLRLGVITQLPTMFVAALVTALRGEIGERVVTTRTAGSLELIEAVRDSRLDLAVVEHPTVLDPSLARSGVARLRRWLLVPSGHALAPRRAVALDALAGSRLAIGLRADNPAAHDLLTDSLAAANVSLAPISAPDDRSAVLVAASGRALSLTADRDLSAPGCHRLTLRGDPLPLRVRMIGRAGSEDLMRAADLRVLRPAGGRSA
jgi:DNA-binding transcriptional LysR family regulator